MVVAGQENSCMWLFGLEDLCGVMEERGLAESGEVRIVDVHAFLRMNFKIDNIVSRKLFISQIV